MVLRRPFARQWLAVLAALGLAAARSPAPFTVVESGQGFGRLQEAVNALGGRDGTIRIAPGRYEDCAVIEAGNVAFVAARPGTAIFEGGVCEGKATLVLRGRSARIQGLAFTGTFVPDGNGAGIRAEKGDVTVTASRFFDAQSGILSANDPTGTIRIDRSTFSGLGKHPDGRGAHGIYSGRYAKLEVTNSRFERGTGGHYLKSRAARVEISGSSFDDSRGRNTNYLIDLPEGATGRISGNVFVNGVDKDNFRTMIAVAAEARMNPSAGLAIENNRAWLVRGFRGATSFVGSWTDERLQIRNNELARGIAAFEQH